MRQIVEIDNEQACQAAERLILMFHLLEVYRRHCPDERKAEAMRRLCARQATRLRQLLADHLEQHGLAPREGTVEVWCRGLEVVLSPRENGRLGLVRLSLTPA